jgi:hypothetical protein
VLLSNKGVCEVLECLECDEELFDKFCDFEEFSYGIEPEEKMCFSNGMIRLFQDLIVNLVDISFGGLKLVSVL